MLNQQELSAHMQQHIGTSFDDYQEFTDFISATTKEGAKISYVTAHTEKGSLVRYHRFNGGYDENEFHVFKSWENKRKPLPSDVVKAWKEAERNPQDNEYASAKSIIPIGARQATQRYNIGSGGYIAKGALMVSYRDNQTGKIITIQTINGELNDKGKYPKIFRGERADTHHLIGKADKSKPLYIAEGYATGVSVHQLTGECVVIVGGKGELKKAALAFKNRCAELIIAGDNDGGNDKRNGGEIKAIEAAEAAGGKVWIPEQSGDWNYIDGSGVAVKVKPIEPSEARKVFNLPEAIEKRERFTFSSGNDLFEQKPIQWLIKGAIEVDTFVGLYGASGSGKSFAAIDMGLCIASGQNWHGHAVDKGRVVYVAGEGKAGIKRRMAAWAQRHGGHDQIRENFLLSNAVPLLPDDTEDFITALKGLDGVGVVVLDTLQRTYSGDENSTKDMTAYVQSIDAIRNALPGVVVMVVHHTGHAAEGRARGSSVLRASLDTEISVQEKGRHRVLTHTKAKESEPFAPLAFELKTETLEWTGDDGEQLSSATLHLDSSYSGRVATKPKLGANQKTALSVLRIMVEHDDLVMDGELQGVTVNEWCAKCNSDNDFTNHIPSRFKERILNQLLDNDLVYIATDGNVRLSA